MYRLLNNTRFSSRIIKRINKIEQQLYVNINSQNRFNQTESTNNINVIRSRYEISQGGNIYLNLSSIKQADIIIKSLWQDHVDVEYGNNNDNYDRFLYKYDIKENKETISLIINVNENNNINSSSYNKRPEINLFIPESLNLNVVGQHLNLNLIGKIQGDINIICDSGNVNIDKLRGEKIDLFLGTSSLVVNKLLEGNCTIKSNNVKAKMINGDIVSINCKDHIDIGAMYAKESLLISNGDIKLDSMHGKSLIRSSDGDISMGGIDGAFDINSEKGHVKLQVNKLSPNLQSRAVAEKGSIICTVDPDMASFVHLESISSKSTRANITIVSSSFEAINDQTSNNNNNNNNNISDIVTNLGVIKGHLTGKHVNNNPLHNKKSNNSGKIDQTGAQLQSLRTLVKGNDACIDSNSDNNNRIGKDLCDMILIAYGNVRLETISWIEVIQRQHGISLSIPVPEVGRTASAKSRAKLILKENEIKNSK